MSASGTHTPPGQPELRRRVRVHASSLEAMRASLGAATRPPALRALARADASDPAMALLDAWAVVCDVVAFSSERIATEGYLRTATERRSVRELARSLGHELRPGAAAEVELAFALETAAGAPAVVTVPRGTPAQSVPGQDELPQVFETSADLEARGAWNALRGVAVRRQVLERGEQAVWLTGRVSAVREGDAVLVVGAERVEDPEGRHRERGDREHWDVRTVAAVVADPPGRPGWTRLDLDRPLGHRPTRPLVARREVEVHVLPERAALFGSTAPDPGLLATGRGLPPGVEEAGGGVRWTGYGAVDPERPDCLELDGDRRSVLPGSWLVVEQPGLTEAYRVVSAEADGASRYGVSGRLTRVRLDTAAGLDLVDRRAAVVSCGSRPLPALVEPVTEPVVPGAVLRLEAADPLLPVGRLLVVEGADPASGVPLTAVTTVLGCELDDPAELGVATMTVTVDPPVELALAPGSWRVHGNVVRAGHGETVQQVLGSGDGRTPFRSLELRRGPLTWVRTGTALGVRPDVELRVDGVRWEPVTDLESAGPQDRVHAVRQDDPAPGSGQAPTRLVLGDGLHGALAPSGAENLTATYRVGVGAAGAVAAGQVRLLVRRPLGVREVVNPAAAHDWAVPDTLEQARTNAPQRVRTLGRVVSVADHADLARGYAGTGQARAELVWDGTTDVVVLTVLAEGGGTPSAGLLTDLRSAVDAVRDPAHVLALLAGQVLWFGVRVGVDHDPAHRRADVEAAVAASLAGALGPGVRPLAEPVTAAGVLVRVRAVPGVRSCTVPELVDLGTGATVAAQAAAGLLSWPAGATDLLPALGARWDGGLRPAQVRALPRGAVHVRAVT